ncbi:response regulator transcription factor [Phycicoccus sonneratiae]|uniref:Response regulator transcription factor n=1 Tax=Phycicoccus sonneratiae TaxID=2807628 RepID=A0ABS2CLV1_9MICO|nr:response regulator transcription factor [Phycicoccus sonneraticus]MBM6400808.1 response regulator transcription factor [Phycicoccus sonneraticus]
MVPPPGTRVLVLDDHAVVRRGLLALLADVTWAGPVVEAGTVAEARELATRLQPGLAVVDVGLPDGDGIDFVTELVRIAPGCRSLVLTMDRSVGTAERALAAGAAGHLAKDSAPELVVDALGTIASGGVVLGWDLVAGRVRVGGAPPAPGARGPLAALSPRELEVARQVAAGVANPVIARHLGISEKTVRNVLSGVLPKVGARDRVHLALLVREHDGPG